MRASGSDCAMAASSYKTYRNRDKNDEHDVWKMVFLSPDGGVMHSKVHRTTISRGCEPRCIPQPCMVGAERPTVIHS